MIRTAFVSLLLLLAAACGSGSGGAADAPADVSLVLTDGATDELAVFEVDVKDVVFTKVNGNTIDVLPRRTRIDFLQLESLGELVAGRALESGAYRRITLNLDFTDARVVLAGQATPAVVKDRAGHAITGVVPVVVEFPNGSRPFVRGGRHNLFVLDLDLDRSVVVDAGANEVTFTPVWTVDVDPTNPKPVASNGTLNSVDLGAGTFVVDRRAPDDTLIGSFTVATTSATVFQIDGAVEVGATGLGSMVGHLGQRVFVQGGLRERDRVLTAVAVEIGAGVPGNGQDWVLGHVVARSGGVGADATISVLGRSFDVATGTRRFHTVHAVNTSFADTKVLRRGAGNGADADAIGIGQLVWAFGDLSSTTLDATATTGVVRLLPTGIFGIANGPASGGNLSLDLARFDRVPVSEFDFTVGGAAQADPDAFVLDLGGLSAAGIGAGSKVRALGWIAGVGATGADATAVSLVNRDVTAQVLFCEWSPAATAVLSGPNNGTLELDISAATTHTVADGFGSVALSASPAPRLAPSGSLGFYGIVVDGALESFTSFSAFRSALLDHAETHPVFRVTAFGRLEGASQRFAAIAATAVLD
ncbi:MAG: DUF4382 domain-containing protein [Planctomycetes bacterium]|nr:DUF4382 domain-containing protein [Planctomycetota bacterium]